MLDLRRKMMLAYYATQNTGRLPKEYQEVEYLESNGSQYIDTGIVRDLTHSYRYTGIVLFNDTSVRQLIGAQGFFYFGTEAGYWQIAQPGSIHTNIPVHANFKYQIDFTADPINRRATFIYNGDTYNLSQEFWDVPNAAKIAVFSLNDRVLPFGGKIYGEWNIYVNEDLARKLIPCYRKSDNVAGMYDLVTNTFYTNQGTGSFIAGPEI